VHEAFEGRLSLAATHIACEEDGAAIDLTER